MDSMSDVDLDRAQQWESGSPEQTKALAGEFVSAWRWPKTIALVGPLGSGKTTFVRGVIRALDVSDSAVRSPSFTLINEYEHPEDQVAHADLYRAEDKNQQETIGLEDYFNRGLLLVEWADRWQGSWPENTGFVRFEYSGEESRLINWRPRIPDQVDDVDKTVKGRA